MMGERGAVADMRNSDGGGVVIRSHYPAALFLSLLALLVDRLGGMGLSRCLCLKCC